MDNTVLQIDIDDVLRQRLPRHYKFIPRPLVNALKRLIHEDELNQIGREIGSSTNSEAARIVLRHFGINLDVKGLDQLPADGRFIFASNHPLGGLDGLALIALLGERYADQIRFIVNDLLSVLSFEADIFLPVNKYGRQSRDRATEIDREYAGDKQMVTFPAGLCSRRMPDGSIRDLPWRKFLVTSALRSKRSIIPVFFDATNSKRFYRLAKWRERLGIKFNAEMLLLPDEMFRCKGSTFRITFGLPVPYTMLDKQAPALVAKELQMATYALQGGNKT